MTKIIHVDMDCFYAAVEVKHRPELKGKPVGVGGPANSRSVLTTASYEARKFGVKSAMPCSQAMRLCPELILVPPNFELYQAESVAVREIFSRFTPLVEPLSLDEAYLDVTGSPHHGGSATRIAHDIRQQIARERGLNASAGIAPNKFLAKIASDWNKPNGQFVIRPEDIAAFMPSLPVEKIYGVGKVTAAKMHHLGLRTCGDIQRLSVTELTRVLGSRGPSLSDLARGIDPRKVEPRSERKSLTVEETFAKDLERLDECLLRIPGLFEDWESRMQRVKERYRIKGLVVKLKCFDFKSTTRESASRSWPTVTAFNTLLVDAWERRRAPVRLIGLGVRLEHAKSSTEDVQLSWEL